MTYADVFFHGLFETLKHPDCIKKGKEIARKIAAGCILCFGPLAWGVSVFACLRLSCFLIFVWFMTCLHNE